MATTLGSRRVRESFNPSEKKIVRVIKRNAAAMIDLLEEQRVNSIDSDWAERTRLFALAQTRYEEAAMWATKAVTA